MTSVIDLNVVLPLILDQHPHRETAVAWWDGCMDEAVLFTLPVRMGVLRLLTNRTVMGSKVLSPDEAWDALQQVTADVRAVVVDEIPPGQEVVWRRLVRAREPTPNLWTDAWLASFAEAIGGEMVTFDRGFQSFGLSRLTLLSAA